MRVRQREPRALMTMDEAAEALSTAEAAVERWAADVADRAHAAEVLAAELAEAEALAGDDLLDLADDPDVVARIAAELVQKRTEQGLAVQAAERAAERLVAARRDVLRARAVSIRTRAVRLREIGTARAARTDQMLAELAEWEGVAFGVAQVSNPLGVVGPALAPWTLTQQVLGRAGWLTDHANHLDRVAAEGRDDEVTSTATATAPELVAAELAVVEARVAV